jgi:hypothetical protein
VEGPFEKFVSIWGAIFPVVKDSVDGTTSTFHRRLEAPQEQFEDVALVPVPQTGQPDTPATTMNCTKPTGIEKFFVTNRAENCLKI